MSFLTDDSDQDLDTLISSTFGDFLAPAKEKERLKIIFTTIREHILNTISSADKRSAFSRTLLGTKQLLELENCVNENCDGLMSCEVTSEILQLIIQKLIEYSENKCLREVITAESIPIMANMWIDGASYKQICDYASENDVRLSAGKRKEIYSLEKSLIFAMMGLDMPQHSLLMRSLSSCNYITKKSKTHVGCWVN